jgi:hypothetical protein
MSLSFFHEGVRIISTSWLAAGPATDVLVDCYTLSETAVHTAQM